MEFTHRGVQTQPAQNANHVGAVATSAGGDSGRKARRRDSFAYGKWIRIISVVLLFSVTILVIAIASLLYYGNDNESKFVVKGDYQAVDLDTGTGSSSNSDQIYFGHIAKLTDKYIVLNNIYYIVPNAQTTPGSAASTSNNNYTLVKLGCELHAPLDQMVINRDHVSFWENLKSSGTVVTKINEYIKQNPNGPNCTTQNATSPTAAAPTATTPATKP